MPRTALLASRPNVGHDVAKGQYDVLLCRLGVFGLFFQLEQSQLAIGRSRCDRRWCGRLWFCVGKGVGNEQHRTLWFR